MPVLDSRAGLGFTSTVFAVLAAIACILLILAIVMHAQKRNIILAILSIELFVLNCFNLFNVLTWSDSDSSRWWEGHGLCDLEVKVFIGFGQSIIGITASIFKQLATILDTRRITLSSDSGVRRKQIVFDAIMVYALPGLLMGLHYIVQPSRYSISRLTGCRVTWDPSWPSVVLLWIWYPLACGICLFYTFLTIFRLLQHRRQVTAILQHSPGGTSKSRFLRLLALSTTFVLFFSPFAAYFFTFNIKGGIGSTYSWAGIHPPQWAKLIVKEHDSNSVAIDRWAQVFAGLLVYLFFGVRKDNTVCLRGAHQSFSCLRRLLRLH